MRSKTKVKRVTVEITKDNEIGLAKGETKTLRARVANDLVKRGGAKFIKIKEVKQEKVD